MWHHPPAAPDVRIGMGVDRRYPRAHGRRDEQTDLAGQRATTRATRGGYERLADDSFEWDKLTKATIPEVTVKLVGKRKTPRPRFYMAARSTDDLEWLAPS